MSQVILYQALVLPFFLLKILLTISKRVLYNAENKIEIISNFDKDLRNDIFQFAVNQGISVLGLQKQERKLEDIFKELTK